MTTVRALVVDDSVVVRRTVANVLDAVDDVEVVGTAADGRLGLRKIAELRPDVVTLDVEMPGLNGLQTLREIRAQWPALPVIMYSTLTERGAEATLEALSLGAADYACKPSGATTREQAADQVRDTLLPLVRLWGRRRPLARRAGAAATPGVGGAAGPVRLASTPSGPVDLVVIGVSTGGPDALATLLPLLPAGLPVPVAIVQHMPAVFTAMLAKRLDQASALTVREAVDDEPALPGTAYIAPGGRHLEVVAARGGTRLRLTDGEPENSCRPAVDVLFRSAARVTGGRLLAVVLTGMGRDGLAGGRLVHAAGGTVLAQDEASSVVWGMPGFVARAGIARAVLPLGELAGRITGLVEQHRVVPA